MWERGCQGKGKKNTFQLEISKTLDVARGKMRCGNWAQYGQKGTQAVPKITEREQGGDSKRPSVQRVEGPHVWLPYNFRSFRNKCCKNRKDLGMSRYRHTCRHIRAYIIFGLQALGVPRAVK